MLWGNYSVLNKTPGRWLGGTSTAHASGVGSAQVQTRSNWGRNGALRNFAITEYSTDAYELASIPAGYGARGWMMPITAGAMAAPSTARGQSTWTGALAEGRNLSGSFAGESSWSGVGQLVVSGSGSFAGSSSWSGVINAALLGSGSFAGASSWSGTLTAKGIMSGAFAGVSSWSAANYATGIMSGSWSSAVELEAQGFSSYLLDQEDIETGLTLRQALRLVTAATAGKISGGGTSTITIRNAVVDGVDRITATVDSSGNRTAITYELD